MHQSTRRHIPDNCNLHIHFCENLNANTLHCSTTRFALFDANFICVPLLAPRTTGMGAEPIDHGRLGG